MSDIPQDLNRPPPAPDPDPLASALADLQPAPPALNRDRLMFAAGAASQRPVARLWMLTAGFLAAMGFAAGMYVRPATVVYIERPTPPVPPVRPAEPAPEPFAPRPEDRSYLPLAADARKVQPADSDAARWLRLRHDVLAAGLGALPDPGRQSGTGDHVGGPVLTFPPLPKAPGPKKVSDPDEPDQPE